jgi:SAM-dependent methyltransferase
MPHYVDYAEYYDQDHDMQVDIPFYLDLARQCGSPVLELACGTGRVAIPLADAGFEVWGIDLSENMLSVCRAKVEQRRLSDRVHLELANMTTFDLPCKDFGLVYVPYRSFMHLFTQQEQIACLERVYRHLRPGGLFAVDLYAPNFAFLASEPDRPFTLVCEFDLSNGHHVIHRGRSVRSDIVNQIQHSELRFEEYDAGGLLVRERTLPLYTRYTFRYELQLLLERVGFEVVDVHGDYDRRPYDGTGEILAVARRPAH